MVDLYWKCYAYGDELKPHIEFLDGIMLSSTRDVAPSCVENVDELIERQEKSLVQLETKRSVVKDLIEKGLEEIKKVKKRFNMVSAFEDLAKRQEIFNTTRDSIMGLFNQIKHNVEVMSLTIPEDKKKLIDKEIKALSEKLTVVSQFEEKVNKIDEFCKSLKEFDGSLKSIDE